MFSHMVKYLSLALDLSVEEVQEILLMGIDDGYTVEQIVRLFQPTHISFADTVTDERRFLADHEWSEKKNRFCKKRQVA